ncbi:MAG: putative lipopolysaccharide heptosyltransferase III [Nitrospirae bacterium]|nr:MAG: putative lipopolysaccharide heptosyltransferase III [Nitrospirota bacterium]
MRNLLVIKLRYIGDVLLATPVLRALRERFPEARLTMAVNRGTEEILKWNPDVQEVMVVEKRGLAAQLRFLRAVRRRRFDTVIDLTDGDRAATLAGLSGAPLRIGFNEEHRWRGLLFTTIAPALPGTVHRVDHDLRALLPLGIEPKASQPRLYTSLEDDERAARLLEEAGLAGAGGPLVMFQPGARYWFKAWPAERFAALAERLSESFGCRVVIGGSESERPLAEEVRRLARSTPTVLAGRTPLLTYASVLKRCRLFVGNDNGPMHMAAALGVPVVALFGPSNPDEWGPRGPEVRVLYKGLDCRPCFHPTCERGEESCMKRISVDEVCAAAGTLLESRERMGERV